MTVTLNRPYSGYASGTVVQLPTNVEAALIAQGFAASASTSASAATATGAVTTTQTSGRVSIAAGSSSVVVTNPAVDVNSKIFAVVNQATADGTLLRVERIVPGAGLFTIYGTANATATTVIDWILFVQSGDTPPVLSAIA
jgi:hypothetical protein